MTDGAWADAIGEADAVINLAGAPAIVRWTPKHTQEIYSSRVDGTHHIVDAMRRVRASRITLINASAVGYYGVAPLGQLDESFPAGNDFLARVCVEWEQEAQKGEELGARVVLIRTGIVLDPSDGALAKLLPSFKLFVGGWLGSGRQPFPWIHIEDELGIILWALDTATVRGPVNAVAPGIVTNRNFSRALGAVMGRPALVPVPSFLVRLLYGDGASTLLGGQWAQPARTMELGYRFHHPELIEALKSLGL